MLRRWLLGALVACALVPATRSDDGDHSANNGGRFAGGGGGGGGDDDEGLVEAIDWHEWITDDEHQQQHPPPAAPPKAWSATRSAPSNKPSSSGVADLSWGPHRAAWAALANASNGGGRDGGGAAPRPPVFLLAGIASTRLVNWRETACKRGSNIKVRAASSQHGIPRWWSLSCLYSPPFQLPAFSGARGGVGEPEEAARDDDHRPDLLG